MNDELVQYRRERSQETLRAAELLLNNELLFAAVNRIYYACFYEVIALLMTKELSSAKHSGIKSLFNRNFVNAGLVSVDNGRFYADMFEYRQKADYVDYTSFEKVRVTEMLETAKKFVDELEELF